MAKLLARASALPTTAPVLPPSPFRWLVRHANERPDALACSLMSADGTWESSTWSDVRIDVERAAAGLIRRGLRPGQVVVSLMHADGLLAGIELAVRATGAIPVKVATGVGVDDMVRLLADTDARFVIADTEADLVQLRGGPLEHAEVVLLEGGAGWERLQAHGAERLIMDPDAVRRIEAMVEPEESAPRRIRHDGSGVVITLVSASLDRMSEAMGPHDTVLVAGSPEGPFVAQVHDAQLAVGAAVAFVSGGADLSFALTTVRPTVVALDEDSAAALEEQFRVHISDIPGAYNLEATLGLDIDQSQDPRLRTALRLQTRSLEEMRPWFGGRLERVLCPGLPPFLERVLRALRIDLPDVRTAAPDPASASLPVRAAVVQGDGSSLARRQRGVLEASFSFAVAGDSLLPKASTRPTSAPASDPPASEAPASEAPANSAPARRLTVSDAATREAWRVGGSVTCLHDLLVRRAARAQQ